MLEADLLGRADVVARLDVAHPPSGEVKLKDDTQPGAAAPQYDKIEFPLIEKTQDLPDVVGAFHDPAFAREAFEFLSGKQAMTIDEYVALAQDYRSKAFTMSGVENTELLTTVKDALAKVVQEGGTQADFRRAVDQAFEDFGVTGPTPYRTNLVFDTNVRQAQSDGEWDQLHEPGVLEAFPFFRYMTRGDERVRLNHAWMNGRVYASGDPIWAEWFPPNGFNCRCWIDYISRSEAEAQGITADTARPEAFGMHSDEGFGLGEKVA